MPNKYLMYLTQNPKFCLLLVIFFNISFGQSTPKLMLFNSKDISPIAKQITITFIIPEKDFLYKDFIACSIDTPTVTLSPWKTDAHSINHYDPSFKETKQVFNETFSISMIASAEQWISDPIYLYCSYYRKTDKKINDVFFTFSFAQPLQTNINFDGTIEPTSSTTINTPHYAHHHYSFVEQYYKKVSTFLRNIIVFFMCHQKTCLSLFLVLISLLLLLFYFFQENMEKYRKLYELLEIIVSLLIFVLLSYGIWQLHGMDKPFSKLLASSIAVLFAMITGIFYIKKSTNVSLGTIRTFYTCIGMLVLISTVFLLFKTIQYADKQMNLFF